MPTATEPVSTGIKKRAVCSFVADAIAPITTGLTTKPAQPHPATVATAPPVFTFPTTPAALRVIGTTHPSPTPSKRVSTFERAERIVAPEVGRSQRVSFLQPKSAVHDDRWNVLIHLATSWNEFVGWNVGFSALRRTNQ